MNIAVQIAAAVTAYGRMHMHDLKNIPDNICYYSDTDSVFLQKPLNEKFISPTKLGLCKLEKETQSCIFLSPKIYIFTYRENGKLHHSIKFKGVNKEALEKLDYNWFLEKYKNTTVFQYEKTSNFLKTLTPPIIFF